MRQSKRGQVDAFIAMDVMEQARRAEVDGRDIVHMEVGQPATGAPSGARRAVAEALETGPLGYTVALGLPELRARIAGHYADWYGVEIAPERVVITSGASAGFLLAFTALFDSGDRVALGLPGYPSYRHILTALSLEAVGIETRHEDRFQPTPGTLPEDIAGLILASPGNPAGTMLGKPELAALIEAAQARGSAVVSDEIYHGIDYERRAVSALEVSDDVIVINSFSKYFSMTGWRIGWMIVPEEMIRTFERLAQNMFICASHASQVAALAAMECGAELQENLKVYARNRALLLEGLPKAGFTRIAPPDGAFYVYADVSEMTDDSLDLCARILREAGVAVTPGLDFDPERGHHFIRFAYAGATERIAEGIDRLIEWHRAR